MRFVIVTGVSGAGKSTALKMLEDARYFCVDNLPVSLFEKMASMAAELTSEDMQNIALGIDARSGENLGKMKEILERMEEHGYHYEVLFLDASDAVLVKRYKETRRKHPLSPDGRIDEGIQKERKLMTYLHDRADYLIDTTHLLTRELKQEVEAIFVENQTFHNLTITVLSFGFKYGIPNDADLVFDVRFLPNPYYIEELRPLTGMDEEVYQYVMQSSVAKEFADKLENMISFLLPHYLDEGKTSLVIAVGCTGGKHRSVTLARELFQRLSKQKGWRMRLENRDIEKDHLRKKGL